MPLTISRQTRRLVPAIVALAVMLATGSNCLAQEKIYITEFMAANLRTLADRDRDYSDWIELHNAGAAAVNLDGWFLTDIRKELKKWRFPAVPIGPGEYLLVFASGKDRRAPGAELHTNFKLNAERGYLGLVKPDGATVAFEFGPEYPRQVAGASYGLDMADKPAALPATVFQRVITVNFDSSIRWGT